MAKAATATPFWRRISQKVSFDKTWLTAHAHQREALLFAALGICGFFAVAMASFDPFDPSPLAVIYPPVPPHNLAGALGATLSALAVYGFGLVALVLPIPILTTAILVVKNRKATLALSRAWGWLLGLVSLATASALYLPTITYHGLDLPSGGMLGTVMSQVLAKWLGTYGTPIALCTIGLVAGLFIARRSIFIPLAEIVRQGLRALHMMEEVSTGQPATEDSEPYAEIDASASGPSKLESLQHSALADHSTESSLDTAPASSHDDYKGLTSIPVPVPSRIDAMPTMPSANTPNTPPAVVPYIQPPLSIFNHSTPTPASDANNKDVEATAALLTKTFADFGITGRIIGHQPGPVVTVFEYELEPGVKQAKVISLIDDLALALKVDSIFIHPVRGKRALGIQVPNNRREAVHLGDVLKSAAFRDCASPLTFGMGKTINGQPMSADLAGMPHLLVAGATGSGKSVCINALLCSIVMKAAPTDVRMLLVDPKMLELSVYEGIPHLLMPVITEPTKASLALQWAVLEMERRYKLMQLASVRNIAAFNDFLATASDSRRDELRAALGENGAVADDAMKKMPYVLLVIDELADLMMTAPKDVENSIQRLAQKARASGIHMVLATQRPSVDIITGVIKANLPCRIAFQVVSKHDSRTILDLMGAEKLLGKGDMLLQRPGIGRLERLQGALITDDEVMKLVAALKASGSVKYDESIISWIDDEYSRRKDRDGAINDDDTHSIDDDPKWSEALAIARAHGMVSASFLQRQLKIGYNRAARLVEHMETKGLVDKADGAKPRKWLGTPTSV